MNSKKLVYEKNNKTRNSNIELLRVISMFFIVISHYAIHNNIHTVDLSFGFNKILLDSIHLGKLGVAVFVMITGYYMSKSTFKISRVINVILQTFFYSVSIYAIMCIVDRKNLSVKDALKNIFPVITSQYWFITAYVVLAFLMPFINLLLSKLSKTQFRALLIVVVFWYAIAPFFFRFDYFTNAGDMSYMIMFYCVGAYLRCFPDNILSKKKNAALFVIIITIVMLLSVVAFDFGALKFDFLKDKSGTLYTVYSPFVLVLSASLLSFFINMKPRNNKFVTTLGGCTLGVYLIHENNLLRYIIWQDFFDNTKYAESPFLILHMLFSVVIVFVACLLIEYVRKYILEKYVFNFINNKIYSFADMVMKRVITVLEK